MNRTARRRRVFRDAADLDLFVRTLSQLPGRFGARVHAWALMGNHYHLLLDAPDGQLPRAMAWFGGTLARSMNAAHGLDGPLFRGRYLNRVVEDDGYWRHLLAYVHLNPLGGRVGHPDQSAWSSHRAYAGLDPAPAWLCREELLGLYGSVDVYRATIDDLVAGRSKLPEVFDEALMWRPPSTTGSRLEPLPATVSTLSPDEALAQVAALCEVSREDLLRDRRGRIGNLPRALAAWWLGRSAMLSRAAVGELLGMSPLAVAGAANRIRRAEGQVAEWRDMLERRWWEPLVAESDDDSGQDAKS